MSAPAGGAGVDRPLGAISELTYENKTCSECRQDVSKDETQAARQTDRLTERQKDRKTDRREKDFSASLSKQKLLRMSTGCHKDRQRDRQTDSQTDRQTEKQKQTDRKTDRRRKDFS